MIWLQYRNHVTATVYSDISDIVGLLYERKRSALERFREHLSIAINNDKLN